MPHTGNWQSLATAVNYLVRIAPIVYLAFQAQPASPAGVQPDSGMGHGINCDLVERPVISDQAQSSIFLC
ncbi:hypothetical protein DSO57_1023417 [Entomophthora muscae]|uniref:Uncharacterized protein n=1 Tax=Entomophthora muscae TaxID=34485 RepID=A0ACC2SRT3_9FUNG|nr:hypothetical protein DSO57_1023417 [Entomophthora muscae]